MEVHAFVHAALARERTDLGLAAVVEELDAERVAELTSELRCEQLGRREADAIREVLPRVEAHLAGGVAEVREEARRAGVDGRLPGLRDLDLLPALARCPR